VTKTKDDKEHYTKGCFAKASSYDHECSLAAGSEKQEKCVTCDNKDYCNAATSASFSFGLVAMAWLVCKMSF